MIQVVVYLQDKYRQCQAFDEGSALVNEQGGDKNDNKSGRGRMRGGSPLLLVLMIIIGCVGYKHPMYRDFYTRAFQM